MEIDTENSAIIAFDIGISNVPEILCHRRLSNPRMNRNSLHAENNVSLIIFIKVIIRRK